jgi:hypothetical protein
MATTAGPGPWSPQANCTLMARTAGNALGTSKAQVRKNLLTWAFALGAGDGNRNRTVSLGSGLSCLR